MQNELCVTLWLYRGGTDYASLQSLQAIYDENLSASTFRRNPHYELMDDYRAIPQLPFNEVHSLDDSQRNDFDNSLAALYARWAAKGTSDNPCTKALARLDQEKKRDQAEVARLNALSAQRPLTSQEKYELRQADVFKSGFDLKECRG